MSDIALYGKDLFGEAIVPPSRGKLADKFDAPPFSVLNAREGWWAERKAAWLRLGIKGEIGRDAAAFNIGDWMEAGASGSRGNAAGISIFDPVLCELMYRWFCPAVGQVIDPFAGGSVRGVVAERLGFRYWGSELRAEQVAANREQAAQLCDEAPAWVCGDAAAELPHSPPGDFVFSCPPYGSLEKYSDDPRDLSAMTPDGFAAAYRQIIKLAVGRLKPDRFACFVVGDYRDKRGHYTNFVGLTASAFVDAGAQLYNEMIYVTPCGSLPVRAAKQFETSRKVGKTHQNVLIFVKGCPRKAADLIAAK